MISHVCPEEIRTANRKEVLEDIWATPEWESNVAGYITIHPHCHFCGKDSQTVHHTDPKDYPKGRGDTVGIARYMNFARSKVVPTCYRCHDELKKGRRICPRCKKHYIAQDELCCYYCLTPEQKKARRDARRKSRDQKRAMREEINQRSRERSQAAYKMKKSKQEVA